MRIALIAAVTALCLNVCLFSADDPALLALAKSIELAAQKQDAATISAACDGDAFCQRVRGKSNGDDKDFYNGFVAGFKGKGSFGVALLEPARRGRLTFLKMRTVDGQQRAQFRSNVPEGINYIEAIFAKDAAGKPQMIDFYIYLSGEFLSDSLRVMYQAGLREQNPTVFEKLFGGSPKLVDTLPKMQQMNKNLAAEDYKGALDVYNSIPKEQRSWKVLQMSRIRAASHMGEAQWLEAIADYERAYPNDAALSFIKMDAYLLMKKYDEALKSLDTLDTAVGGDGYLNVLRANIQTMSGHTAEGTKLAQKAIADEPNSSDAHGALLDSYVTAKDYANAVKELDVFATKFGWDDTALAGNPAYADFLGSKEYKAWKAARK